MSNLSMKTVLIIIIHLSHEKRTKVFFEDVSKKYHKLKVSKSISYARHFKISGPFSLIFSIEFLKIKNKIIWLHAFKSSEN